MFAYVIGEMWIGVCVAVVIDLVPADLTTSSVAVYFFIIQIIGGNMPLLVPPIEEAIGLQLALVITFPGMYVVGAIFFIFSLLVIINRKKPEIPDDLSLKKSDNRSDKSSMKSYEEADHIYTKSSDILGANDELAIKHAAEQDSPTIGDSIRL